MKKINLLLVYCLFVNLAFAQGKEDNQKIVIGKTDSIQSKILGEKRKIWVHLPDGANQKYPVVYLLDGDGHFSSVVGMIQQLSTTNGNMMCPKMIVVGINNTNRMRDLTPSRVSSDPLMDSTMTKTTGGGENFTEFIEKELFPYIDSIYPSAPYRILIGHSLGGLMVINTLINHPNLFNSYVAIDPSMWWDDGKLLKQTQKELAKKKWDGKNLFLGIANTMDEGMDIKTVQKDTSAYTRHIRSILTLQAAFEKNNKNGLIYKGKYYPDDTHGSAPLITEYDALRFFFDFYPLKVTDKDYVDSIGTIAEKYQNQFAEISRKMGYQIKPNEDEINYMGYHFLGKKMYKTANRFFKLNVDNYPENPNVYDSYGDYFIAIGDKPNAIIQLKKALSILENEVIRKKLMALKSDEK